MLFDQDYGGRPLAYETFGNPADQRLPFGANFGPACLFSDDLNPVSRLDGTNRAKTYPRPFPHVDGHVKINVRGGRRARLGKIADDPARARKKAKLQMIRVFVRVICRSAVYTIK